ncbi:MAG: type II toxin-antitoxin system RelE/ParE family toxin [Bifidobacteriaceae bacterium]|nr:type II toxin-antitoxin system RelE/ParE family toxin [Bifidobacteriaceae bacterium]
MTSVAVFRQDFLSEVDAASFWLAAHAGTATAACFLDEVDSAIGRVERDPKSFRFDELFGARRIHVSGFRYLVWFLPAGEIVKILALTHESMSDITVTRLVAGQARET